MKTFLENSGNKEKEKFTLALVPIYKQCQWKHWWPKIAMFSHSRLILHLSKVCKKWRGPNTFQRNCTSTSKANCLIAMIQFTWPAFTKKLHCWVVWPGASFIIFGHRIWFINFLMLKSVSTFRTFPDQAYQQIRCCKQVQLRTNWS